MTQPSSPGQRPVAAPERPRRGSSARRAGPGGSRRRGPGRTRDSSALAGTTAPVSCSTARSRPSRPRRPPPTPCHCGRKRASSAAATGSTSCAQRGERAAPQQPQHLGVAELRAVATAVLGREQLALDDAARAETSRRSASWTTAGPTPHHAATVCDGEGAVGAGEAGDEVAERVGHRLEEGLRARRRAGRCRGRRAGGRRPRWRPSGRRRRRARR